MSSSNYKIEGSIKKNPQPTITQNRLSEKILPEDSKTDGYAAHKGFSYPKSSEFFEFTIWDQIIDFGLLTPTNPVIRKTKLRVSNPAMGYTVGIIQDHPLLASRSPSVEAGRSGLASDSAIFLPDTTCDNGKCSETAAAAWNNTLSFGFGYRCNDLRGNDCISDFLNPSYYKSLPSQSAGQKAQIIMQNPKASKTREAEIVYKINISGTQSPQSYSNRISLIAIPNY